MREIQRSNRFPDYSQIALFDVEDLTSIPDWETGREAYALGQKGIVVATANSTGVGDPVEIIGYEGSGEAPGIFLVSAIIEVGNNGLFVGDPIYASDPTGAISWPQGKRRMSVYVDDLVPYPGNVKQVAFVLEHLS